MEISITEKSNSILIALTREGMRNAVEGLSRMCKKEMQVSDVGVGIISLYDLPKMVGELESETVALYLRAEGELAGQILIMLPYQQAIDLVDTLLEQPLGTTACLDNMAKSALGEVGNLCGTFFLNSVAHMTGISSRPTPPAVVIDMIGSILDIVIATSAQNTENIVLLKAEIVDETQEHQATLWVIPDTGSLTNLHERDL